MYYSRGDKVYNFEQELKDHIEHLQDVLKNLPGVQQGMLITDNFGRVVDRVGRYSMNPPWYREFYRLHGKKPNKKELEMIARVHLTKGYYDNYGFIPPLHLR